jgi:DNA-binding CsgD family transcriptional regulator
MSLRVDDAAIVDLLGSAYGEDQDDATFVDGVMRAVMAMAGARSGVFMRYASGYDEEGRFSFRSISEVVSFGPDAVAGAEFTEALRDLPIAELLWGRTHGNVMSQITGFGERLPTMPGWHTHWGHGIVDSVGLTSLDARGHGVGICAGLAHQGSLSLRETRLLARLATHLGARDRLRDVEGARRLGEADVVFSTAGKVVHARDEVVANARTGAAREGLAARDFARKSRHSAEKALEVWQGLVDGRWSIVDHVDTDGRRFVLAVKNAPRVDRRANLTPTQRRVTALAAMGHADKEIGYMLGVPATAVDAALRRARRKLGARSRTELAMIWRRWTDET